MRLTLDELQRAVKQTLDEERVSGDLRSEIVRVLGSIVLVEGSLEQLAEAANDRLDVVEHMGRSLAVSFKPAVLSKLVHHRSAEVRKLAARGLPQQLAQRLAADRSSSVRYAVAKRSKPDFVKEMLKKFPNDDQLRVIYRQKKLTEAGISAPTVEKEPFDYYGKERLGDAVKQASGPDLSEQWYRDRAFKFLQDYGSNIEYQWEELLARRYCSSVKATSGVEIDEAKLLKTIKKLIEEKEDVALERDALKETLGWLADRESLNEAAMPIIEEEVDPIADLLASRLSPYEFVERANAVFSVREASLPPAIRKHRLGENGTKPDSIPVIGKLPHSCGFRRVDEQALDRYVECWNERQSVKGEPLKLSWSLHPDQVGKVSFNVTLK